MPRQPLRWDLGSSLRTAGVDEAGRGPLAGPVFAAAVLLPREATESLLGIQDSKKLTAKRRELLAQRIQEEAEAWAVAEASVEEIATQNILNASFLAMRRAVQKLELRPEAILVDGNQDPHFELPTQMVVDGDAIFACVAAASILAKVARDARMQELHQRFPQYGFDQHKGYGTEAHCAAILKHGPCEEHRRLFLRKILKTTDELGSQP